MTERIDFDLSHQVHEVGAIGRLKQLDTFVIAAGESFSLDFHAGIRLSPLNRALVLDGVIDVAVFATPLRHIYGSNWEQFLVAGEDEKITFPVVANPAGDNAHMGYLGVGDLSSLRSLPRWLTEAYDRLWARYWINPAAFSNEDLDQLYIQNLPTDADTATFGRPVMRLKTPWTTGMSNTRAVATSALRNIPNPAGISLVDIAHAKAKYGRALTRDWSARRDNDFVSRLWGGSLGPDADQRPVLLARDRAFLSGHDIEGRDDATLGTFAGIANGQFRVMVPMKYCPEHAVVSVVMALRFPIVHQDEVATLVTKANPSYDDISSDPVMLRSKPPRNYLNQEFFPSQSSGSVGWRPHGEALRYHPAHVHPFFKRAKSWPFLREATVQAAPAGIPHPDITSGISTDGDGWKNVFSNRELGHFQVHANCALTKRSSIPTAEEAIRIGVRS